MKKGITLVELLAVIIILGIVTSIAVPIVLNVISVSRMNAYVKNVEMVRKAAEGYVSKNTGILPELIGDTSEVSINQLVLSGFIDEVKNPYNRSENCSGYVVILKNNQDKYEYIPHLKCGLNINDSTEDNLVLHYRFDDFEEPTLNLAQNYIQMMTGRTGYNVQVIPNQRLDEYNTNNAHRIIITGGDGNSTIPSARTIVSNAQNEDRTFTTSVIVKNIGTKDVGIRNNIGSTTWVLPGEVKQVVQTGTGRGPGTSHYMFNIGLRQANDEADFLLYQLMSEEKTYNTPYTDDTRSGMVVDYSGNGNHAELQLNSTPRWISDSITGRGAYEFKDNNSSFIMTGFNPGYSANDSFTFAMWVKFKSPIEYQSRLFSVDRSYSQSHGFYTETGGNVAFVVRTDTHIISRRFQPVVNTWYNIVGVYDGSLKSMKLYVNGEQKGATVTYSPSGVLLSNTQIVLNRTGAWSGGHNQGNTHSYIDQVRIYNRVLLEEEIKLIYEYSKR